MATLVRDVAQHAVDPLDVSRAELYRDDVWQAPFAKLRAESPVHYVEHSDYGPYWSVSTYKGIVEVESLPDLYSSEAGGITIADFVAERDVRMPMFIARDRPVHTGQRRTVAPAFTPSEMTRMSGDIRRRTADMLDSLPWNTPFDWVDTVAIELTTQMLAILFDFPWADRRKLTFWSDWAGDIELVKSEELRQQRLVHMFECGSYFKTLWDAKIDKAPTPDLISMMIHSDAMSHMDHNEFIGNLILLIVGGNDTTRNSMSALAYGLDKFPESRAKLEADPALIPNAVSEILRWQTPLAHMRRTATADAELMGQQIKAGDIELVRNEESRKVRLGHLFECGAYFQTLWNAKVDKAPTPDLISMMIHSDAMAHMEHHEFIGNLVLLIVGGNDTTRNSMSALAYGLDKFPESRAKLEADPTLIPNAVSEILRWQTPLAHMRRTAVKDTELMGQQIKAGDKLALWYLSANRDASVFGDDADAIRVDRPNARRHLAFGHGIHRCVGARLAEMQIAILLEEMARRRMRINVLAEPTRVAACFVHGYRTLPVEISRY